MSEKTELKENQFKLSNGDICEVIGSTVTNISDMQRKKLEAEANTDNYDEESEE